jgi:hypothetical protein
MLQKQGVTDLSGIGIALTLGPVGDCAPRAWLKQRLRSTSERSQIAPREPASWRLRCDLPEPERPWQSSSRGAAGRQ